MSLQPVPSSALKPVHGARWPHLPGLALAAAIAALSLALGMLPWLQARGFSALTLAIIGGIALGNARRTALAAPWAAGITFSKHWLLRAGIVLYGLRLTFQDIGQIGVTGLLIDALVLTSTFALACWLGIRVLRMEPQAAMLIGAGSAICGAAAVMATDPVVRGRPAQVSVAVSTVVVFGTLAMFLYPVLYALLSSHGWLAMDARRFGMFTGATVHEVAQVVAAGRALGDAAADTAVITKMVRVMLLAPFLVLLSLGLSRGRTAARTAPRAKITVPWFAFAFVAVAGFNSLHWLPAPLLHGLVMLDTVLLAMAMAALGLTTRVSALREAGLKPLLLAGALFVWLLCGGLVIQQAVLSLQ